MFPEWVVTDQEGNKRIRYTLSIQMELIQAIKEQQAQIEALREEVRRQK